MSHFKFVSFGIAAVISIATIDALGQTLAAQVVPAHPASPQQALQVKARIKTNVLAQPPSRAVHQPDPPVVPLRNPDAAIELHATPEVSWGGAQPNFIDRVYFSRSADDTEPLPTPASDQLGAWRRVVWEKGGLWLIVEVAHAPKEQRLCVRWPDGQGDAARAECKSLGPGKMHLAFESANSRLWRSGTYVVELYLAPPSSDEQADYLGSVAYGAGGFAEMASKAAPQAHPPQDIPQFPWPPPRPTTRATLGHALFSDANDTFGAVAEQLAAALSRARYSQPAYYAVPDGFAMVTRLEQIEADGTPMPESERWNVNLPPRKKFSLNNFVSALFDAPEGNYRVIVFVVSDHPFATGTDVVTNLEANAWLSGGLDRLPSFIGARKFSEDTGCVALIYQFVKNFNDPGNVSNPTNFAPAETQLVRSRIEIGP